jgi:hypothetical protein
VAGHHARCSQVIGDNLVPLSLDLAAISLDRLLVLVWCAVRGTGARDVWRHVLRRVELRCEAALGAP